MADEQDIVVTANRQAPVDRKPIDVFLPNYNLEQLPVETISQPARLPNVRQGEKGWRNVLGVIGDSLLIGSRRDPIYHPGLQQRREREAMQYWQENPEAATYLMSQWNPDRALQMSREVANQGAREEQLRIQQENALSQQTARAEMEIQRRIGNLSRVAGFINNQQAYQVVRPRLQQELNSIPGLENVELPPMWGPEAQQAISQIGGMGMTNYQANRLGQLQEGIGIRRESAQSQANARRATQAIQQQRLQQGRENLNLRREGLDLRREDTTSKIRAREAQQNPVRPSERIRSSIPASASRELPPGLPAGSTNLGNGVYQLPDGRKVRVKQ